MVFRLGLASARLTRLANLTHCVNLHTLDLSRNRLASAEGLAGCVKLARLDLSHNQLRPADGLGFLAAPQAPELKGHESPRAAVIAAAQQISSSKSRKRD